MLPCPVAKRGQHVTDAEALRLRDADARHMGMQRSRSLCKAAVFMQARLYTRNELMPGQQTPSECGQLLGRSARSLACAVQSLQASGQPARELAVQCCCDGYLKKMISSDNVHLLVHT